MNLRLNQTGKPLEDLWMIAGKAGIPLNTLPAMVELDSYVYNTTRNGVPAMGKSMVCCVFVCNMWKAGGLFADIGGDVNCAELTNWDDYALTILDAPARPPQCVAADPDNNLCQLLGAQTLSLNDYATKAPYAWMAQECPSEAPKYLKPANC